MAGASSRVFKMLITGDAKDAVKASKEAEGAADSMGGKIAGAGAMAAAGMLAAGTAVVAIGLKSADTFTTVGGEVMKLQRYTGGSAEDMSRLRFQFQQTGVDVDAGAKAIGIFSKKLEANEEAGTKSADALRKHTDELKEQRDELLKNGDLTDSQREKLEDLNETIQANEDRLNGASPAFEKFGVELKNADGSTRSMQEILGDVADKFKDMPNGIEKTAMAQQLFGKSGADLIPFLNKGRDGLAELSTEAEKYGLVLGQDQLDAVKKSKDAHRDLDAAMQGVQVSIGQYVLPMVTAVVRWFADMIPKALQAAKQWFNDHRATIEQWAAKAHEIFEWVKTFVIEQVWPRLVAAIQKAIQVIVAIGTYLKEHRELLIGVAVAIATLLVAAFISWAVSAAAAAIATLAAIWPILAIIAVIALVVAAVLWLWNNWDQVWNWIKDAAAAVWNWIKDAAQAFIDWLISGFEYGLNLINGIWQDVWNAVQAVVQAVWDAIVWYVTTYINVVKTVINTVIAGVLWVWNNAWNTVSSVVTGVWNTIVGVVSWAITTARNVINNELAAIAWVWNAVWNGVTSFVSGVWDGIVGSIKGGINGAIRLLNSFIDFVNGIQFHIKIPDWVPFVGGKGFDFNGLGLGHVPYLHTGGTFVAPTGSDEGLAMLRTGERVVPAGSAGQEGGVQIVVQGSLLLERDLLGLIDKAKQSGFRPAWATIR